MAWLEYWHKINETDERERAFHSSPGTLFWSQTVPTGAWLKCNYCVSVVPFVWVQGWVKPISFRGCLWRPCWERKSASHSLMPVDIRFHFFSPHWPRLPLCGMITRVYLLSWCVHWTGLYVFALQQTQGEVNCAETKFSCTDDFPPQEGDMVQLPLSPCLWPQISVL